MSACFYGLLLLILQCRVFEKLILLNQRITVSSSIVPFCVEVETTAKSAVKQNGLLFSSIHTGNLNKDNNEYII